MAFQRNQDGKRDIGEILSSHSDIPHYYGDYVRRFFMVAAVITLLALPFFPGMLPWGGVLGSLVLAASLVLCAGLTSPMRRLVIYFNLALSFFGMLVFEYAAVTMYAGDPLILSVFRQIMAIIFASSLYYSGKSLRGVKALAAGSLI
ncbi:hypothetical protein K8Q93_03365 [Candidatus Parcubacteria bacterium]|nr:hypothetical protein [Candidatus Parcubacteria bacterium]